MKTTTINCFGESVNVFARKASYRDGTLAIEIVEIDPEGEEEPWGVLTVNMNDSRQSKTRAFVKDWSENEAWARQFIAKSGIGKPVEDEYASSGYILTQLFEFDLSKIEE